jgi:hypothetical protein
MREALIDGKLDLRVLDGDLGDDVVTELLDPVWAPAHGGRIQISAKTETRERTGRSPDDADAIILAMHEPKLVGSTRPSRSLTDGGPRAEGLTPSYPSWVLGRRLGTNGR